jgi:hypothetical protein
VWVNLTSTVPENCRVSSSTGNGTNWINNGVAEEAKPNVIKNINKHYEGLIFIVWSLFLDEPKFPATQF